METLEIPIAEESAELSQWDDAPPHALEEEEMDILAFELWQRGSRQDAAAEEDCSGAEETVAGRASCL